jgi:hypothetical protein
MPRRFNSSFTMFVYLRGHPLLEYYFGVLDTHLSANDWDATGLSAEVSVSPSEAGLRPA